MKFYRKKKRIRVLCRREGAQWKRAQRRPGGGTRAGSQGGPCEQLSQITMAPSASPLISRTTEPETEWTDLGLLDGNPRSVLYFERIFLARVIV